MSANGTSAAARSGASQTEGDSNSSSGNDARVSAPPLVPVSNTYLEELSRRIRARPIPWEGYARADLVSDEELKMIRAADGSSGGGNRSGHSGIEAQLQDSSDESGAGASLGDKYAQLYTRLLAKLTRTDTLQQILVLIGDMLDGHDERAALFLNAKAVDQGNAWPWQPLVKLLDTQDDFCQLKAAQFITLLLVSPSSKQSTTPSYVLDRQLAFISSLVHSGGSGAGASNWRGTPGSGALAPPSAQGGFAEGNGASLGLQLFEALLRSVYFRQLVWDDEMRKIGDEPSKTQSGEQGSDAPEAEQASERKSLIAGLRAILASTLVPRSNVSALSGQDAGSSSGTSTPTPGSRQSGAAASGAQTPIGTVGVQMVYQVAFCFWLLSFDQEIAAQLNTKFGIVPILADVARNAVKEKVIRVIVATFRNLAEKAPTNNLPAMLGAKALPLMDALSGRKWSDEEIMDDVAVVKQALGEKLKVMSTYEQYISELASGRLTWDNPVHATDDFWKHNTARLLEASASDDFNKESGLSMLLNLLKTDSEGEALQQPDGKPDKDDDKDKDKDAHHRPRSAKAARDPATLAIACNDLGKMLHASPEGGVRKRIDKAGGKAYIMALMQHEDGQVKFYALNTVAKLVSASWRV